MKSVVALSSRITFPREIGRRRAKQEKELMRGRGGKEASRPLVENYF